MVIIRDVCLFSSEYKKGESRGMGWEVMSHYNYDECHFVTLSNDI
jgi:hypothetical protein